MLKFFYLLQWHILEKCQGGASTKCAEHAKVCVVISYYYIAQIIMPTASQNDTPASMRCQRPAGLSDSNTNIGKNGHFDICFQHWSLWRAVGTKDAYGAFQQIDQEGWTRMGSPPVSALYKVHEAVLPCLQLSFVGCYHYRDTIRPQACAHAAPAFAMSAKAGVAKPCRRCLLRS